MVKVCKSKSVLLSVHQMLLATLARSEGICDGMPSTAHSSLKLFCFGLFNLFFGLYEYSREKRWRNTFDLLSIRYRQFWNGNIPGRGNTSYVSK